MAVKAKSEFHELYSGEVQLEFRPGRHQYFVAGDQVPSVTGIVAVINKPALVYWAVNQMEEDLAERWQPGKAYDEVEIAEALAEAKKAHRRTTRKAATVGSLAHDWISQYIAGEEPELPVNQNVLQAVKAFLAWVEANRVKFHLTERKVYSRKHGFAGTLDFEARVNGEMVIGDLKTSSGIWPEFALQTAAYQHARQEETGKRYRKRLILRLGKDPRLDGGIDFEIHELTRFRDDFKAFLGALSLKRRLEELSKEQLA